MPTLANLLAVRTRRMLSQRDLAERADVSPTTILHAEQGKPVTMKTARKLAEALNVEPLALVGDNE